MKLVSFFNADIRVKVEKSILVKRFIVSIFKAENVCIENVTYIFCSDNYLLNINQAFLKHDTFTDIITFPLSNLGEPIIAEIYISIERVKENAKTFVVSYQNELLRVIIHGALHLCNYQDKTRKQKLIMRAKENYYLNQFNVSREVPL